NANYRRDTMENTRAIIIPKRKQCDKKSLQFKVIRLKEEIINRSKYPQIIQLSSEDAKKLNNFAKKFNEYSEIWESLMEKIIRIISELEMIYNRNEYFDMTEILLSHIINIAISYI